MFQNTVAYYQLGKLCTSESIAEPLVTGYRMTTALSALRSFSDSCVPSKVRDN